MKNYLDPWQGLYSSPLSFFWYFLKKYDTAAMNRKNDTLEAFTGIRFFNVYKIWLCKFCLRSMKSIET